MAVPFIKLPKIKIPKIKNPLTGRTITLGKTIDRVASKVPGIPNLGLADSVQSALNKRGNSSTPSIIPPSQGEAFAPTSQNLGNTPVNAGFMQSDFMASGWRLLDKIGVPYPMNVQIAKYSKVALALGLAVYLVNMALPRHKKLWR